MDEVFPFKNKILGGFDKQDVTDYIKAMSDEREKIASENDSLKSEISKLRSEGDKLGSRLEDAQESVENLSAENESLHSRIDRIQEEFNEELKLRDAENARLAEELDSVREYVRNRRSEELNSVRTAVDGIDNGWSEARKSLDDGIGQIKDSVEGLLSMLNGLFTETEDGFDMMTGDMEDDDFPSEDAESGTQD